MSQLNARLINLCPKKRNNVTSVRIYFSYVSIVLLLGSTNNGGLDIFQCCLKGLFFFFKSILVVDVEDVEVRFFVWEVIKRGGVFSRNGMRGSLIKGNWGEGVA